VKRDKLYKDTNMLGSLFNFTTVRTFSFQSSMFSIH